MESSDFNTSSIWDGWHCWNNSTKSKRRDISCFGLILWSAVAIFGTSKTTWRTIWKTIHRANNFIWSIGRKQSDINAWSIENSPVWHESFTRNLSWLCTDRGGLWKGDIMIADIEELEKMGASEIYPRRINAKEILIRQKQDEFIFPFADGTANLSGRDCEFREPTLRRERTERSEDLSGELQGRTGRVSTGRTRRRRWRGRADFWSIQGDFIYRHHVEPRVQLYVPKEETYPIPPKYIYVIKSTHTDLDVMQEKRKDEYWNIDSNRNLSDSWKIFTKFTLLKEKHPNGKMWSGERMTKVHMTTRPDSEKPEVWTKIGKAAQNRENQEWAKEKPKFDNARRLTGIFFIGLDDEEYREILWKNARRKLEGHHESGCEVGNCIREDFHNSSCLHHGISWIYKATSGIFSAQKSRRPHCRQRVYFDVTL